MSEQQPTVEYREIPGFLGYRVGDDGSVWTLRRGEPTRMAVTLAGGASGHGRGHWSVILSTKGSQSRRYVHRLVLLAFVGDPPPGTEACHNDGNRDNNSRANLRWDTRKANVADAARHGQRHNPVLPGERNGRAKLTQGRVNEIRRLLAAGSSRRSLCEKFDISISQMSNIARGVQWKTS